MIKRAKARTTKIPKVHAKLNMFQGHGHSVKARDNEPTVTAAEAVTADVIRHGSTVFRNESRGSHTSPDRTITWRLKHLSSGRELSKERNRNVGAKVTEGQGRMRRFFLRKISFL